MTDAMTGAGNDPVTAPADEQIGPDDGVPENGVTGDTGCTSTGFAACDKPVRYVQQLVSHWSHKMATSYDKDTGMGVFPFSETTHAVMTAYEGGEASKPRSGIGLTLTTATLAENENMRGVLERHIDRFAFREAPLEYSWTVQQ